MSLSEKNADDLYKESDPYFDEESPRKNIEKGVQLVFEAAEKGSADAAARLAIFYNTGRYLKHDLEESRKWAEIGAKGGNVEAKVLYGFYLWCENKNQEALAWLKSVYEEIKDPSNLYHVHYYVYVCKVLAELAYEEKLLDECHFYANKAVESGCDDAKPILALSILNDDKDRALKLIKESSDQENPYGAIIYALSLIPSEDAFSDIPDYEKSVNYLMDYANNDENDKEIRGYASYAAGLYFLEIVHNMDDAYDWFQKGVSLGNKHCEGFIRGIECYRRYYK